MKGTRHFATQASLWHAVRQSVTLQKLHLAKKTRLLRAKFCIFDGWKGVVILVKWHIGEMALWQNDVSKWRLCDGGTRTLYERSKKNLLRNF